MMLGFDFGEENSCLVPANHVGCRKVDRSRYVGFLVMRADFKVIACREEIIQEGVVWAIVLQFIGGHFVHEVKRGLNV